MDLFLGYRSALPPFSPHFNGQMPLLQRWETHLVRTGAVGVPDESVVSTIATAFGKHYLHLLSYLPVDAVLYQCVRAAYQQHVPTMSHPYQIPDQLVRSLWLIVNRWPLSPAATKFVLFYFRLLRFRSTIRLSQILVQALAHSSRLR
jgi:hypothetical protein